MTCNPESSQKPAKSTSLSHFVAMEMTWASISFRRPVSQIPYPDFRKWYEDRTKFAELSGLIRFPRVIPRPVPDFVVAIVGHSFQAYLDPAEFGIGEFL